MKTYKLKSAIIDGDKELVLEELEAIKMSLAEDSYLMAEILSPEGLSAIHTLLIEDMNVNPRLLRLRVRVQNKRRRAFLFVQAMINGVNYLK